MPAPAELEQPAQLPNEGDFDPTDPTDYGDTINLYEALYRYSRWPYYRSDIPWAIERLAEARRERSELLRSLSRSSGAERRAEYEHLEAMLE